MGRHPAGEIFKCIFCTENDCTLAEFVPECPIHQSHKSHNAPVPYPTMHHSEQKCSHFCSECWIVGYGTGELWDLWLRSIDNKSILVWLMAWCHYENTYQGRVFLLSLLASLLHFLFLCFMIMSLTRGCKKQNNPRSRSQVKVSDGAMCINYISHRFMQTTITVMVNSLTPNDAICHEWFWSAMVQVMACWLLKA